MTPRSGDAGSERPAVGDLTYADAGHELDGIIEEFEAGVVDVDRLVERLERATEIVDELDRRLRRTRMRVEELVPRLEAIGRSEARDEEVVVPGGEPDVLEDPDDGYPDDGYPDEQDEGYPVESGSERGGSATDDPAPGLF